MKTYLYLILAFILFSCLENNHQKADKLNPLEKLMDGNKRFLSNHSIHPGQTLERMRQLKKGQHPFAVIMSCSDSRVPPELIFDQGLGDIFSVRTAGNVIGEYELGSIEYAVEHLGCKLVMILGHENCGAIYAYLHQDTEKHQDHIKSLIDYISNEIEEKRIPDSLKSNIDYAVKANIEHGMNLLKNSEPTIKKHFFKKNIQIIGAIYDLDTGEVRIVE